MMKGDPVVARQYNRRGCSISIDTGLRLQTCTAKIILVKNNKYDDDDDNIIIII